MLGTTPVSLYDVWGCGDAAPAELEWQMKRILLVFGTRPEAIKMLPVASALAREPDIEPIICVTGQHREMLDSVLSLFQVQPQYDLNIMRRVQGLEQMTSAVLEGVGRLVDKVRPDYVLVHGDTTTAMAAALAAFYKKVTVGHVEAGLRSGDTAQPWPEEANRRIVTVLANLHFAPTQGAQANLLAEGVASSAIFVTGNTVIDALHSAAARLRDSPALIADVASKLGFLTPDKPILLVTGHRRENFGEPFRNICEAIRDLAATGRIQVVYPLHLNPNVRAPVTEVLGNLKDVHLIEPLGFTLDDARLRRAGLDYHEWVTLRTWRDLDAWRDAHPRQRLFACSTRGSTRYDQAEIGIDDAILFGPETRGLPQHLLDTLTPKHLLRLPMRPGNRSLNLSNSVAVVVFEIWRRNGFAGSD